MDNAAAWRKWKKLAEITVERGASIHEAETAKRLAAVLAARFNFAGVREEEPATRPDTRWREDFDVRFTRAERRAAVRWNWEYRTCGKRRCKCMRAGALHGPYKYAKIRSGNKVSSVYLGKE